MQYSEKDEEASKHAPGEAGFNGLRTEAYRLGQ